VTSTTTCSGCGAVLPTSGLPPDPGRNNSPECWHLYGEVVGFELNHTAELGRFHQLTVDAYGAQHAPREGSGIRLAYSLVGLHLAIDLGRNGLEVREAHQRMGKPQPSWPRFSGPMAPAGVTVEDVAKAGFRTESVAGHARALTRWSEAVWSGWTAEHPAVAQLTVELFGRPEPL
jgi:hypothetical protein